jgi:type IV secretory pathway VirB9-like protein
MNGVVRFVAIAFAIMFGTHAHAQGIRDVSYTDRSIVSVQAKLRFTTLIVLPEGERILDFVCGDKDFWIVSGVDNLAYVKPAKAGASTNLNLISDSGRVYSFLLTESSGDPDLKVYVVVDDIAVKNVTSKHWYTAADVEVFRHQAEQAREEAAAVRASSERAASESIAAFRSSYPIQLRFTYEYRAHEKPFSVSAIYHDGQFTYIHSHSSELPSLYELRDGAPSLVPFQVERGVYVVPKVLERAYLAIGKQRFFFAQRGER